MFKILLVDDEPTIVDGLYELFREYKAENLDIYKAYSAKAALDWLYKKKIDIVITDIKMPEMDGLQLLEAIRQNWPDCKVIFLTGYDEFEYVYKAIQHEGVSYILKIESYATIVKTVEKQIADIKYSYLNEELVKKVEQRIKKALPLLQKEFLVNLVQGEQTEISQQQLDELEIPLNIEKPVFLIVAFSDHEPDSKSTNYSVSCVVEQYLSPYTRLAGLIYNSLYLMWLVQPIDDNQNNMPNTSSFYYKNILETVQEVCKKTLNCRTSYIISREKITWDQIPYKFTALKTTLNLYMRHDMEVIAMDMESDCNEPRLLMNSHEKKFEMLEAYLEIGNRDEFTAVFLSLQDICNHRFTSGSFNYDIAYSMSMLFISYIRRHGLENVINSVMDTTQLWNAVFTSQDEIFLYYGRLADSIFEIQIAETKKRSVSAISTIQDYIQSNLEADLSLSSLADIVHFNPKYLSRLFKQVTGVNLLDYINDKKLIKAKELLKQSNIKIHNIAKEVGYASNSYFAKFFKKNTNMTPQEYRDSYINSGEKAIK